MSPTARNARAAAPLVLLVAGPALAHAPRAADAHAGAWPFEPWLLALLSTSATLYAIGVLRLWQRAGRGRGIRVGHVAAFAAGWITVAGALASPIDPLGGHLFSVHMLQHELLMLVAAPLLVVARPLAAWTWALPARSRPVVGGALRARLWRLCWRTLRSPPGAWLLHAAALWGWHAPALFSLALRDPFVHSLQHASFLGTALLFWWAVLGSKARARTGVALLALFTTMVHMTVLGALITLSPRPWYSAYATTSAALGVDALADQQLGGLLMWIPGGLAYLAIGLWLASRWLRDDDQRVPAANPRPSAT
ncbi:MAG TPA: cytochrome c oxidase assembly protein [Zeimonas sp.]